MINPRDPYWLRLITLAVGAAVALSAAALATLPLTAEEAGAHVDEPAAPHGFHVSPVTESEGPEAGVVEYAVEVKNDEPGLVSNLSAVFEGVTLVEVGDTVESFSGRVGLAGVGSHEAASHEVVAVGAASLGFSLQATSISAAGSLTLEVEAPSGKTWTGSGAALSKSLSLSALDLAEGGEGTYVATVAHAGGLRAISYDLASTLVHPPPEATLTFSGLAANETHTFLWFAEAGSSSDVRVRVSGERFEAGGEPRRYTYVAGVATEPVEVEGMVPWVLLTAGEFLGFAALAFLLAGAGSGVARARGGRVKSQERTRRSVWWHRAAYLSVVAILPAHGAVQFASGHFQLATAAVGTAAFAGIVGLVWFNAYRRDLVLALPWRRWLTLKTSAVLVVFGFATLHIVLFGRIFAG